MDAAIDPPSITVGARRYFTASPTSSEKNKTPTGMVHVWLVTKLFDQMAVLRPIVGPQPHGREDDCDEPKEDDHPDLRISSLALAAGIILCRLLWRGRLSLLRCQTCCSPSYVQLRMAHNQYRFVRADGICKDNLNYRIHFSAWEHILKTDCFLCVKTRKAMHLAGFLKCVSSNSYIFSLSQIVFKRIASRCTARIESQLTEDRMNMPIDCVRADDKASGNLFVAESQSKKSQHLDFTCRQFFILLIDKWFCSSR